MDGLSIDRQRQNWANVQTRQQTIGDLAESIKTLESLKLWFGFLRSEIDHYGDVGAAKALNRIEDEVGRARDQLRATTHRLGKLGNIGGQW